MATKGWATETDVNATDLARSFEDAGVAAIIYTDINRDGAMGGPNIPCHRKPGASSLDPRDRIRWRILSGRPSQPSRPQRLNRGGHLRACAIYDGAIDLEASAQGTRLIIFSVLKNPGVRPQAEGQSPFPQADQSRLSDAYVENPYHPVS